MPDNLFIAAAKINGLLWNRRRKQNNVTCLPSTASIPEKFQLPSCIPSWPPGSGFASGSICLGEIEVCQVSEFVKVWSCLEGGKDNKGASFFKPVKLPQGFYSLGYYGQPNCVPFQGWVLAAKEIPVSSEVQYESQSNKAFLEAEGASTRLLSSSHEGVKSHYPSRTLPALAKPVTYTLVWNSNYWPGSQDGHACFWVPEPPDGYKPVGCVITNTPHKPSLDEIRCVREDLTDFSEPHNLVWSTATKFPGHFSAWNLRPQHRGMHARGLSVGTFFCSSSGIPKNHSVACLKNLDFSLKEMPNIDQINMLIRHYGPTIFFHPDEIYLPSSVSWFFQQGAMLCERGIQNANFIASDGSNLPFGGTNDGKYWLNLPNDNRANGLKRGNLDSAEVYAHVKPSLGGTFTDIAMWLFCPFNGPGTAKVGVINLPLGKIGEHVCDWEHFTLRISNFTGELHSIYLSQHSGGVWVKPCDLEFIVGNKAVIYCAKSGHAMFAHAGVHLQGDSRLGVGLRNDTARSRFSLDTSKKYQVVAAEYLQHVGSRNLLLQPPWLDYMREWGPTISYNTRNELDKVLRLLPSPIKHKIEKLFNKLPNELSHQQGPTGPKVKDNWEGDERG